MAKKDLDSITVQELADEANVNKKTFIIIITAWPIS